jgi:signal transduction histidine kinase
MQVQNNEIISVIIIGGIMALLLVFFIVSVLFLYQRRQQKHEKTLVQLKEEYDQELLRSQLEIQEKTLKNISQELHDNIGQMLSVAKLSIAQAGIKKDHPAYNGIQAAKEVLNQAILDLANLTKSLHTDRIVEIGLESAIEFEINTLLKTGLIAIDFSAPVNEYHRTLDSQTSIFIYRMFQEILNNTLKHSKATHINVLMNYTQDPTFLLKVEDNGTGFNVGEKQNSSAPGTGVGLKSMINRAKLIGAEFLIDSKIGEGTSVSILLPLHNQSISKA